MNEMIKSDERNVPMVTPSIQTIESAFSNIDRFEDAQRMAGMLAKSKLVPVAFQNDVPNCVIALEMSTRLGASPLAVMQNLYIVHGNPSWSAQYVIAAVNTSGKFQPLRFRVTGECDERSCVAWTRDATGEVLEGPAVSIAMAKSEGWYGKKGSKWQTLPELMLRYRAATFFGRLYAPELMMGMKTVEEVNDTYDLNKIDAAGNVIDDVATTTQALNASLKVGKPQRKPTQKSNQKAETATQADAQADGDVDEPKSTDDTPGALMAEKQRKVAIKFKSALALERCRDDMNACTDIDSLDEVVDAARGEITNPVHKNLAKEHYILCARKLEGKE